jgi:6-phosphogluconolactonase (cycloisomerase 2 family)
MNTRRSRRAFLQGIGYTAAFSVLSKSIPAQTALASAPPLAYAYVASAGSEIHVFEVRGDDWMCKQSIPSRSPASLAFHPVQRVLYVANEISEYEWLPRGTVEAYRMDASDGTLALINRQQLSLSGIRPRHLAVSPDGKYLVVAIHGGGAYNVLPIESDGTVGRVIQIFKEVGTGPHPIYQASAHPHTVVFDPAGQHVLTTDEGCGRISIFTFRNGKMERTAQILHRPECGPGHLAMHPSGRFFYVSNRLDSSIACYRWDTHKAVTSESMTPTAEIHRLLVSLSGDVLYAASAEGISLWQIDPGGGKLSFRQQWNPKNRSLVSLSLSSDGQRLFAIDSQQHEVISVPVQGESGDLGTASAVTKITSPMALVMKHKFG